MTSQWWHGAVVYQLYLRSFADGDGDGVGDFAGLRARLGHIASLGVDAIWLNPCYRSPQRDHGYDVADYFAPDPAYGDLAELKDLIADAHAAGLKVLMDIVPNHCSDQHEWFRQALAATPGSPERGRFIFRDGAGPAGDEPPNNWQSVFGGPAWTRTRDGQWYFHSFDASQPDFDWRNPEVRAYFEQVLRHWFDLGVDGFRVDVAHGLVKAAAMPDQLPEADGGFGHNAAMWDQPEVHEVYRAWHGVADEYDPPRYLVGEIWVPDLARLAAYTTDELDQAFDFGLLVAPFRADALRAAIDAGLAQASAAGPAWALNNHDVHRSATRYGQDQDAAAPPAHDMIAAARRRDPVDVALGQARARAAALMLLALPGTVFLYQGEELGLPEVLDLPDSVRQDPIFIRSGGTEAGRDGCRIPLPWRASGSSLGFGPDGAARPWLPQPEWFAGYSVEAEQDDPASTLSLYREALRLRSRLFGDEPLVWLDAEGGVLAFRRGRGALALNTTDSPAPLPRGAGRIWCVSDALLGSAMLPANSAAWFEIDPGDAT